MFSNRKSSFLSSWIVISIALATTMVQGATHFYGGSISYKLEVVGGKTYAHVELFTGWALTQGPCGATCSKTSIGSSTRNTRAQMEQSTGNTAYFGTFMTDYGHHSVNITDLTSTVQANFTETVYDVDEMGKWEQDLMKFTFLLPYNEVDINFEGQFWRPILLSGSVISNARWHLQTRISADIRSDTNSYNKVPRIISKPVYRVKLGTYTEIRIIATDPDGDYVQCEYSHFVESGVLYIAKGVEVKESCSVYINATTTLGYSDDSWIAVSVSVKDYNRHKITLGTDAYLPFKFALASSTLQFLVNILREVDVPTFIAPTLENGHDFIIYAGATWSGIFYAQAAENSTIDEFNIVNLDQENFVMSSINDGSEQGVKYVDVTWETSAADIGHHVLCISAVDNTGVVSDSLCFKLEVRENTMAYTTHGGTTYFINAPGPNQEVICEADITCFLPIYARSPSEVRTINVGESYTEESSISKVQTIQYNGATVYKATLSFSDPSSNYKPICFNALSNKQDTLASACIKIAIQSKDPCVSSPCRNSAECISDRRTGAFMCDCIAHTYGTLCEYKKDFCTPQPCDIGAAACYDMPSTMYCYCLPGFTGEFCETNINDCQPSACNNRGICKDLMQNYTCVCHSRYEGNDCSTDTCTSANKDDLVCQAADMCNGHGVGSNSGGCTCMLGYKNSQNCSTGIGALPVTGVEFLKSSPKDGELQTCFVNGTFVDCQISMHLATDSGSVPPHVTFETTSELGPLVTLGSIQPSTNFQGITNVYSITATIKGSLSAKEDQFLCFTANTDTTQASQCLQLQFVSNPLLVPSSIASMQLNATVHFIPPTMNEGSVLVCNVTERCRLTMLTELNGPVCQNVLSPTKGVTVFPTRLESDVCVTEIAYKFSNSSANKTDICFQSSQTDFQQRCYEVEIPSPACRSAPCQNGGHCFRNRKRNAVEDIQCICNNGYSGNRCEKGPCPVNNCHNDAYCLINNGTETCLCKAGFYGQKCELSHNPKPCFETSFTSTAQPSALQCVRFQTCSFTIIAEGSTGGQSPNIIPGYVSPSIQLGGLSILPIKDAGGYLVNTIFKSAKEGAHTLCIQTQSGSAQNLDELCIQVDVITDVSSLYGFKDRPHFIQPSLPANAHLKCIEGEQCHVLFHLTPGEGKESEGVSVTVKKSGDFEQFYVHSTCETPGKNCTVDISLSPGAQDVAQEKQICVETSLTSSTTDGEERCFYFTTSLPTSELKGCQKFHCKNGGFCDGHKSDNPVCYCALGFSGKECDQPTNTPSTTFLGDLGIPSDVQCMVGEDCSIPFETFVVQGDTTDISFSYVDPRVSSYSLTCDIEEYSDTVYMGVTTFRAMEMGTYKTCIQSNDSTSVETDEFCLLINAVKGTSSEQIVDMSKPHFLSPTLPRDSTVLCSTNKTCHLNLHFTNGDQFGNSQKCPTVMDTSANKNEMKHLFSPTYGDSACESDLVYITPTAPATSQVCVQLSLPGKKGENRCFTIKVVDDVPKEKTSACIGGACNRSGTCEDGQLSSLMKDNCKCRMKRKQDPSKDAFAGGGFITAIAIAIVSVGAGIGACFIATIVVIVICKSKNKNAVSEFNNAKENSQGQQIAAVENKL